MKPRKRKYVQPTVSKKGILQYCEPNLRDFPVVPLSPMAKVFQKKRKLRTVKVS